MATKLCLSCPARAGHPVIAYVRRILGHRWLLGRPPARTMTAESRHSDNPDSATNRERGQYSTARRGGGGAGEDRTPDLLIANEALSQLSYGPATSSPRPATLEWASDSKPAGRHCP